MRLFAVTLFAVLAFASPAFASSVSIQSVNIATPSAAAGAQTVYRVSFTVSASGALSGTNSVRVTLPPQTTAPDWQGGTLRDVTRGLDVGSCTNPNTTGFSTCTFFSGATNFLAAGSQGLVTLRGITNLGAGSGRTVQMTTTTDVDTATSPGFTIAPGASLSTPTVTINTPSAATGARTSWVIATTVSGSGALSAEAGSDIFVTLPPDTTAPQWQGGTIHDVTRNVDVGSCTNPHTTHVATCGFFSSAFVNAGDQLTITLNGITNGAANAASTLKVRSSSDLPDVTSNPFAIVTGASVSKPSVSLATPSAAEGARTRYAITTTVSPTGGLTADAGSQIIITLPEDITAPNWQGGAIHDDTRNVDVGSCSNPHSTQISTCGFFSNAFVNPGDRLVITLRGVTNGAIGSKTLKISTTSDLPDVVSDNFQVVGGGSLSRPAVSIDAPSAATGAQTRWVITSTVSATGGMAADAGSQIVVTLPVDASAPDWQGGSIHDNTRGVDVGSCSNPDTTDVSTCGFFSNAFVNAGDQLVITLRGVTNGPAGSKTLKVSTSSDLPDVDSDPFQVVAGATLTTPTVAIDTPTAATGARTRWVINTRVSATGGMSAEAGSEITLTLPDDTTAPQWQSGTIHDVTRNVDVGSCSNPNTTHVSTCGYFSNAFVNAGDRLQIILRGITNGAATTKSLKVKTTSDLPDVTSDGFDVTAAHPATVAVKAGSLAASAATPYVVTLATSITGGLAADVLSQITLTFPTGTTFPGYTSGTVYDVSRAVSVGSCAAPQTLTITCAFFSSAFSTSGDVLRITFPTITNPPTAGALTARTTSDTATVSSGAYTTGDITPPDTTITGSQIPYSFSSPDGGVAFQCRIDSGAFTGCTSPYTPPASVPPGNHTLYVRALDADGNPDLSPATRSFSVIGALDTTITSGPASPGNDSTPTFTFTGNGTGFECSIDAEPFEACTSPFALGAVLDGSHTLLVRAIDDTNVDASPATRTFVIDTVAPETAVAPASAPPFSFTGGASYECSIDGGAFAACASPYAPPPLAAGGHTLAVRAVDAAGNRDATPFTQAFTVAGQPPEPTPTVVATAQPSPTPSATATPTPTPTPVPNQTVVAAPVSGTIKVCTAVGVNCKVLAAGQAIPVGSVVDAKAGRVEVTAIPVAGAPPEKAVFYAGIFKLTQKNGVTDLALVEPLASCKKAKASAGKKVKTRKLWGQGKGAFRTTGNYSAATVRGTKWLVQDSCAGTLTQVTEGVVSVRDIPARKTITLRAGKKYLAKPKR